MLVAISPDERAEAAEQLLRSAHRYAQALAADWTVMCVETPSFLEMAKRGEDTRIDMFRLAEALGAERTNIVAASAAEALREYVKQRGVRTLLVGAPRARAGVRLLRSSTPTVLMQQCPDVDVIVIARAGAGGNTERGGGSGVVPWRERGMALYAAALGLTALCTVIALPMLDHFDLIDMVMVYMLGATFAALRLGRGPALCASLANIAAFDFFFVPPRFSFFFTDPHYFVTFGVMLSVAVIIANLVSAVRQQTAAAASRERKTDTLYAMSRELAVTRDARTMALVAEQHIAEVSRGSVTVLVPDEGGALHRGGANEAMGANGANDDHGVDPEIAHWVLQHRQRAGLGAAQFGAGRSIYLPLLGGLEPRGVLVVRPVDPRHALLPEQGRLLEALAGQLALALERVRLGELAEAAHVVAERTALRNTLLASISHDLRTPLAAIAGAGSMLALTSSPLDTHRCATLGLLIEDKALEMTEVLSNVLELLRLETGSFVLKREWHALDELIATTLQRNQVKLAQWRVFVDLPADLPLLFVEATMMVQLFSNVVENCTKHTAPGTTISISASVHDAILLVGIEDNGAGFPPGDPERLFDKFERGRTESNVAGVGLGLAICRAVARLHDGDIRASRVEEGGSRFEITLPLAESSGITSTDQS